jgi:WD40 repeat protein
VWDSFSGAEILQARELHTDCIRFVTFSPDGMHIASGGVDAVIRFRASLSGEQVSPPLRGHQDTINSIVFASDGRHLVTCSDDNTIRIWEVPARTFSRFESDEGDKVYRELNTDEDTPVIRGHEARVSSVDISPDGRRLVSGSWDRTVRRWDMASGEQVLPAMLGHEDDVVFVQFSTDGMRVVSCSCDKTIRVWDAVIGGQALLTLRGHEGVVYSASFSPDRTRIASVSLDQTIRIWDAISGGHAILTLQCPELAKDMKARGEADDEEDEEDEEFTLGKLTYSPDGTRIIFEGDDNHVNLWDAVSGEMLTDQEYECPKHTITVTDGWIVAATGQVMSKIPAFCETSCSAAREGAVAVGTFGGQVVIIHCPMSLFFTSDMLTAMLEQWNSNQDGGAVDEESSDPCHIIAATTFQTADEALDMPEGPLLYLPINLMVEDNTG